MKEAKREIREKMQIQKGNEVAKSLYEKYGFRILEGYEIYILRNP